MRKNVQGTVYLLCFRDPATGAHCKYKHAGHYIGFAEELSSRIADHRRGAGARLTAVIKSAGLTFDVVRTWEGSRELERKLKAAKSAYSLCPHCRQSFLDKRAAAKRKS